MMYRKPPESEPTIPKSPVPKAGTPSNNQKGKLNIKTVALPKRLRLRTFKCQTCSYVCHSEKERNQHHKDKHGLLTCAVCNEVFNTPSGLHRHKYRHTDRKFTCETCGDQYPFESQLKDHRIKHLRGKGHTCFTNNCGKAFKNKSSLTRHLKSHEGKLFTCPEKGCNYSNPDERNLKSHMILSLEHFSIQLHQMRGTF